MQFEHSQFLWGLLLLVPLLLLLKRHQDSLSTHFDKAILKKMYYHKGTTPLWVRHALFIAALAFAIIALARPIIDHGEVKVKSSDIDIIVGFDISHSMFADDIYPDRFSFAKRKFDTFLKDMKQARIGVIGFSSRAFLVSPLTRDFNSLKFLVKNMKFDYMSLKGTDIMSALEVTNNLLEKSQKKALLLFTDGGDKRDYTKEIAYAKEHHITLFIYAIGTDKGGVIKTQQGVLKDKNGDIVVVKRNDAIKALALESGGSYLRGSLAKNDIKALADSITKQFKNSEKKEHTIRDTKELFVYPLGLAMLLFLLSFSSLPQRRKR
jgi:Ca-activated chloride channel family protein